MDNPPKPKPEDEQGLVKLYTELTGSNESAARAVLMHLESPEPEAGSTPGASEPAPPKPEGIREEPE
jgi:hypothetical protein